MVGVDDLGADFVAANKVGLAVGVEDLGADLVVAIIEGLTVGVDDLDADFKFGIEVLAVGVADLGPDLVADRVKEGRAVGVEDLLVVEADLGAELVERIEEGLAVGVEDLLVVEDPNGTAEVLFTNRVGLEVGVDDLTGFVPIANVVRTTGVADLLELEAVLIPPDEDVPLLPASKQIVEDKIESGDDSSPSGAGTDAGLACCDFDFKSVGRVPEFPL